MVDDDEAICDAVSQMLEALGHQVATANSLQQAKSCLQGMRYDNILLDFMLPDGSGLHLVDEYRDEPDAPYITLITGHPSVKNIVAELCGEKINHLIKPIRLDDLKTALSHKSLSEEDNVNHFGCLVGESDAMHEVYRMIERVSQTPANVMLMGESGCGKEVVAQAIHNASGSEKSLIAANCGAFSRELIGSELFGHEKGAFTGAVARKAGFFEQANNSSLFLDEITEMPIDIQPNLLRVLETGKVTRVGGVTSFDVNCRVISATNRPYEDLAESEILREDLYFRLAVFPISIPPLRERAGDITLLSQTFINELNKQNGTHFALSESQLVVLNNYDWPGNVRELRHTLHRAFIMTDPNAETIELPLEISSPFTKTRKVSGQVTAGQKIDDVERQLIQATLEKLDGDKPKAADMLGISLKTLYNRLNKYGEQVS